VLASASSATPALCIEHSVTVDMADGQPLPPLVEDGVVWHVVRRANGRTMWRRLLLTSAVTTKFVSTTSSRRRLFAG
jgi:hypothetical protein